jgi:hypothetical protein
MNDYTYDSVTAEQYEDYLNAMYGTEEDYMQATDTEENN